MAEQLPIWQDPGVEPPALLKTNGWQPGMKPSAQHMNWLFNRVFKCLEEIQAGGGTEELEQELADLQQALETHLAETGQQKHIIVSDILPVNQSIGGIWYETGLGESEETGGGEGGLVLQNAIVADDPPGDTTKIWLDI